jgi:hypothetical protein
VTVAPDRHGGGTPGSVVTYQHTITNTGNASDTFSVSATSTAGWPVQVVDATGTPVPSVTLARGASRTVTVRVTIPLDAVEGTKDITTLTAMSTTDASVVGRATDSTTAGVLSVTPDRSASGTPGGYVDYTHTIANRTGATGTFDLSASSLLGFPVSIRNASGNPITEVTLANGESVSVTLRVSIPVGASLGAQDTARLTVSLRSNPTISANARDLTRVRAGIEASPNRVSNAGVGTYVSYRHTITNNWSAEQTATLTAVSSLGWPVTIFDTDGVTPITGVRLAPFGGSREVVVRVYVPPGTASGTIDTTTLTATGVTSGHTAQATGVTTVRALATYDSAGYSRQVNDFLLGQTVYARATGLTPKASVQFVWKNPSGTPVRTSAIRTVDTQGMAFDDIPLGLGDPTGGWIVELQDTSGNVLQAWPFTVGFNAKITALSATDAATIGSTVAVQSSTRNDSAAAINGSTMTYVIWWDQDGSGTFTAGDIYIDSAGAPHTWNGSAVVSTRITTGIDVPAGGTWTEPAPWTVSNQLFPNQGMYKVSATWRTSGGALIDTVIGDFYSIPVLGWPLAIATVAAGVTFAWRRRGELGLS